MKLRPTNQYTRLYPLGTEKSLLSAGREEMAEAVQWHRFRPLTDESEKEDSSGWVSAWSPLRFEESDLFPGSLFEGESMVLGYRVDEWRYPTQLLKARCAEKEVALMTESGKQKLFRSEKTAIREEVRRRLRLKGTPAMKATLVVYEFTSGVLTVFSRSGKVVNGVWELFEASFGAQLARTNVQVRMSLAGLDPAEFTDLQRAEFA